MDGGEPGVAGPGAVAAVCFEVVQEIAGQRGVQVAEVKLAGLLSGPPGGEGEQQAPGVAVGGDGVRAGVALLVSRSVKNACRVGASAVMAGSPGGVPGAGRRVS